MVKTGLPSLDGRGAHGSDGSDFPNAHAAFHHGKRVFDGLKIGMETIAVFFSAYNPCLATGRTAQALLFPAMGNDIALPFLLVKKTEFVRARLIPDGYGCERKRMHIQKNPAGLAG